MKTSMNFVNSNFSLLLFLPILNAKSGKYGRYARVNGINYSEKRMKELGYDLKAVTKDEISKINSDFRIFNIAVMEEDRQAKLSDRFKQVETCLDSDPVEIVKNEYATSPVAFVANLKDSGMIDAYHGCGKGTAYMKEGYVIAFHYGYEKPENAPTDCESAKVELSCAQVCFS